MTEATLEVSRRNREDAEQGYKDFLVLLETIDKIKIQSNRIHEIVVVLDEIAFQTNLLSLNASVVAARAGGEDGKSFSVVAEEVRKLSQRSLVSSKEIAKLINGSVELASDGHKLASQSGKSLAEIVKVVEKNEYLNRDIAHTNRTQLDSAANLLSHLSRVKELSGGNYQFANESSLIAIQLSDQTKKLSELVHVLRFNIKGEKKERSPREGTLEEITES